MSKIRTITLASFGVVLLGALVIVVLSPKEGLFVLAVLAFTFAVIYRSFIAPFDREQKLQREGTQAKAKILGIADGGVTINEDPVVRFTLEVYPPEGEPYQAEMKTLISRLSVSNYQPGTVIPVRVDPADPANLALDRDAEAAPAVPDELIQGKEGVELAREFVERIDRSNEALRQKGESAPALIIKAFELGMEVNGENPAMAFLLRVRPEGRAAFQSLATGIVSQASIVKYQPGCTIYVKYDPADVSRVALDHS